MVLMYLAANENLRLNRSYIELRSITLCRVGNQVRQVLCITFKQNLMKKIVSLQKRDERYLAI